MKPRLLHRALPVALLVPIILSAVLYTGSPGTVSAQEPLSVRGKVVNGTEGFAVPADLAVLMLVTGADGTLSGTGQAAINVDGRFVFEDAPRVAGGVYTLSVDYGGVFYGLSLPSEEIDGEHTITVYEPTEDAGIIVVGRQVMVVTGFNVSERMATVTEFVRFENPTDRTLQPNLETARPGMFSFMRFALPPGATDVTVQSDLRGGEVISVGTGFALTAPVPPGEHSVDFAYTFPYEGGSVAYRNSLPQGAGIFQILVPDRWDDVNVSGIDSRQPVGIQEGIYRAWEGRDIPPGPGVDLEISGLPQPGVMSALGSTLGGGSFWLAAIPSAMGAVLLGLLVLGVARRYRPATAGDIIAEDEVSTGSNSFVSSRAELVEELAALDERFQRGHVEERHYLERRAELVAQALDDPESGA